MIKVRFKTSKWSRYQEKVFTTEDKWNDYHKWYDENTRGVILDFNIEPLDLAKFSGKFTDTEVRLIRRYLNNDSDTELKREVIKLFNSKL